MTQLKCSDYGFECDFVTSAKSDNVAVQFSEHTEDVHGIEYPIQAIDQIIYRKSWILINSVIFSFSYLYWFLMIPKNVFTAFAVLFFLSATIIPIQNLIVWGPDFVMDFYTFSEITAEKLSIGVIGLGLFMLFFGYKKKDSLQ